MVWDLGDVIPLSIEIRDADGHLANASDVQLTVTLPDGSIFNSGTILPVETGRYEYDYQTIQAGRHSVRWVATGTNASAFTDSFVVDPADDGDFISLRDTKAFLNLDMERSTYDDMLRTFITAACEMITDRMGPVSPKTIEERIYCGKEKLILNHYPVISVTSVEMVPGPVPIPQGDPISGTAGWYLDQPEIGILKHTYRFSGELRIVYRVGRSPLPSNFRLAALELVAHLWRSSQMNSGGGRPQVNMDGQVIAGTTFALPYSVRQLLGLDKRSQSRVML